MSGSSLQMDIDTDSSSVTITGGGSVQLNDESDDADEAHESLNQIK